MTLYAKLIKAAFGWWVYMVQDIWGWSPFMALWIHVIAIWALVGVPLLVVFSSNHS